MKPFIVPATILLLLPLGCGGEGSRSVTAEEALSMIQNDSGVVLLDVRTKEEFEGDLGHLEGAVLIPVQELGQRSSELLPFKDRTILAYCRTGRRSLKATEMLTEQGYRVLNVEGGMVGWNNKNLPHVVRGND